MITKLLLIIIFFFIVPTAVGMSLSVFIKEEKANIIFSFALGYIIEFMIFQLVAIPFIMQEKTFMELYKLYMIILAVISLIALIINIKNYKEILKNTIEFFKNVPKISLIIFLILLGAECFIGYKYYNYDYDDSSFVALASEAYQKNTLYKYGTNGEEFKGLPARRFLSPFSIYTASAAKFTNTDPVIVAHTYFATIFPIVVFAMYYCFGKKLFNNDLKKTFNFLIILNIIYLFGCFSLQSKSTFFFNRIWQGKSMLANFVIPFLFISYDNFINNENKFISWLIILFTMIASCMVSTMGFALAPIVLVALTFAYIFRVKKPIYLLYMFTSALTCIPTLIYIAIYLSTKGVI